MKIVCIGDSLTYGYKLKRHEVWTELIKKKYNAEVLNKGINGDTTGGMLARFYIDVIDNRPSHVIIMGGSNDLMMNVPLSVIQANISAMVNQAGANNIIPIIAIQPLAEPKMAQKNWCGLTDFTKINNGILQLKEWIIEFSNNFDVKVIDFCEELSKNITEENKHEIYLDGLHFTPKGNEIMADVVKI